MTDVPSIKGSAFVSVMDDVKQLVAEGLIDLDQLGLSEAERSHFSGVITPVSWMPMTLYAMLLEVLAKIEGGSDPEGYLRRRGRKAAERLLTGAYGGFAQGEWGLRAADGLVRIAGLLYNFSTWSFEEADGVVTIRITEAAGFPEPARHTAHGFLECFANHLSGGKAQVSSRRAAPDEIELIVR